MKKPIVVSVIMALMLLVWGLFALAHAQDPAKEEKPTFYRLTPGVYVNGWPRFSRPRSSKRAASGNGTAIRGMLFHIDPTTIMILRFISYCKKWGG
jgi:hypothetical protein